MNGETLRLDKKVFSAARVVYHLLENFGTFGWKVNGKRGFISLHWNFFLDEHVFKRVSPVFLLFFLTCKLSSLSTI